MQIDPDVVQNMMIDIVSARSTASVVQGRANTDEDEVISVSSCEAVEDISEDDGEVPSLGISDDEAPYWEVSDEEVISISSGE